MSQHEITADTILDECVDRIIRGEEWQSVVHRYPRLAAEIRPLARLTEELAVELSAAPLLFSTQTRLWQLIQLRNRLGPYWMFARTLMRSRDQLRDWNREAPALIGMLVTSAMSSAGLLTALAAGVRTLP